MLPPASRRRGKRAREARPADARGEAQRRSAPAQVAETQAASSTGAPRTSAALSSSKSSSIAAAAAAKRASWRCVVVGAAHRSKAPGRVRALQAGVHTLRRPRSACAVAACVACRRRVRGHRGGRAQHAPAQPQALPAQSPPPATRRSSRPRARAQPCRCSAAGHASIAAPKLAQTHTQCAIVRSGSAQSCVAAAHVKSTGEISAAAAKSSSAGSSSMPERLRPRLSIAHPADERSQAAEAPSRQEQMRVRRAAARRSWTGGGV